jgi:N-acetylglutamate synthase-like GNAT family acetyltransferase
LYIRNRIPGKDDPFLIDMVVKNFKSQANIAPSVIKYSNEAMVVCDSNHQIVGFVSYSFRLGKVIFIDYLLIDPQYQGKGVASKFLPAFEEHLVNRGIETVIATVDNENARALELYKRWGFTIQGNVFNGIVISKQLKATASTNDKEPKKQEPTKQYVTSQRVRRLQSPPSLRFKG